VRELTMLIRELAERTGVSPRALRHYEDTGLLTPGRSSGGYRLFTEDDVVRVRQIRRMIDAGMGTTQIRRYIDCARNGDHGFQLDMCPDLRAELDELAVRLSEARQAIQAKQQNLRALTASSPERLPGSPC
jgi:DNA-binding transcriptional MerR regulator